MNQPRLKTALRCVAIIAGLFGIFELWMASAMFGSSFTAANAPSRIGIFFAILFLIPGVYLIWVFFLTWFRFSPKAILHLCGGIGFVLWALPAGLLYSANDRYGIAALIWCLAVIAGYRAVSRYLVRRLFTQVSEPKPA